VYLCPGLIRQGTAPDTVSHVYRLSARIAFFFLLIPPPPRSTLFPYTTLFRSLPDGNTTIIIQGKNRFAIKEFVSEEPFLTAKIRSEEHTSELQSHLNLVCRLLLEKKKSAPRGRRGVIQSRSATIPLSHSTRAP